MDGESRNNHNWANYGSMYINSILQLLGIFFPKFDVSFTNWVSFFKTLFHVLNRNPPHGNLMFQSIVNSYAILIYSVLGPFWSKRFFYRGVIVLQLKIEGLKLRHFIRGDRIRAGTPFSQLSLQTQFLSLQWIRQELEYKIKFLYWFECVGTISIIYNVYDCCEFRKYKVLSL